MRVETLLVEDFRSYERAEIRFGSGITALLGPNGAGKTNLLEAIQLVARGDSPRAGEDPELVRWGATLARVTVRFSSASDGVSGDPTSLELLLFAPAPGERRRSRRYLVNGAGRRAEDALGQLKVVAFFPEDVELLNEAPAARRRYLDAMVSQVDRRHRVETREYGRVVEQRNALLRLMREQGHAPAELAFWDGELCRLAAAVSLRRARAVVELAPAFRTAAATLAGAEGSEITYIGQVQGESEPVRAEQYHALLAEKRERELWQATTLVGPHREDLAVRANGRALSTFASRGEHRSAVLALKLAEAAWIQAHSGEAPIFLLDDVLSELDPRRSNALVGALSEGAQALITAAMPTGLPPSLVERAQVISVPLVAS